MDLTFQPPLPEVEGCAPYILRERCDPYHPSSPNGWSYQAKCATCQWTSVRWVSPVAANEDIRGHLAGERFPF